MIKYFSSCPQHSLYMEEVDISCQTRISISNEWFRLKNDI